MKEYFKEKLKVDLDLFKLYIAVILVMGGGIASLMLRDKFGETKIDYFLSIVGFIFLAFLSIVSINSYIQIRKDLKELKKNKK